MSKNIEEIVNDISPIPFIGSKNEQEQSINAGVNLANRAFKQALTEKKLCVPMSEESILKMIENHFNNGRWDHELAEAIYQAQFGGKK